MSDQVLPGARSYRPGEWFGILGEHVTVLLPAGEKPRVGALWELVDDGAGFDVALDALISGGLRDLPGFALIAAAGTETKVVLRGAVAATLTTPEGPVELDGASAATWVERSLESVSSLSVRVGGVAPAEASYVVDGGLVRLGELHAPPTDVGAPSRDEHEVGERLGGPAAAPPPSPPGPPGPPPGFGPPPVGPPVGPPVPESLPDAPEMPVDAPIAPPVDEVPVAAGGFPPPDAQFPPPAPGDPLDGSPEGPSAESTEPTAADADDLPADAPADEMAPLSEPGDVDSLDPPGSDPMPLPTGDPLFDDLGPAPVEPSPLDPPSADHDGLTRAGVSPDAGQQLPGIPGQPLAPAITSKPVATLIFSTGEQVDVDRVIVVGRAPEARQFSATEHPRLVTVPSAHSEISSTHLEIRPGSGADHGSAVVTDMASTNGTVLRQPGLDPEDLTPGVPVQLIPGAEVDLGDGVTIHVTRP